jgi:hypothetical protein
MEFVPDPAWGYLMRPSQMVSSYGFPVVINALGLRGPEVSVPKRAGRLRVLFVGDSITYGGGRIPEEALFCRVFESEARPRGLEVEAVNLSAPGWSPQNWRAYIQRHGLLDADAVVVVLPEVNLSRPFSTMDVHGFRQHAPGLRVVSFGLKLAAMVAPARRPHSDVRATIEANVAALSFVRDLSAGKPFLTVFVPNQGGAASPEAWGPFEAAVPDALDLRSAMRGRPLFFDGLHLNVEGHRLVAARTLERLADPLRRRTDPRALLPEAAHAGTGRQLPRARSPESPPE